MTLTLTPTYTLTPTLTLTLTLTLTQGVREGALKTALGRRPLRKLLELEPAALEKQAGL